MKSEEHNGTRNCKTRYSVELFPRKLGQIFLSISFALINDHLFKHLFDLKNNLSWLLFRIFFSLLVLFHFELVVYLIWVYYWNFCYELFYVYLFCLTFHIYYFLYFISLFIFYVFIYLYSLSFDVFYIILFCHFLTILFLFIQSFIY